MEQREVRAVFDDETIVVYQAYPQPIADAALAAGTFVAPFRTERMTWIKPSFLWMMYRCGWARKPDQERVLAVRITRAGFEEALAASCLSHFDAEHHESYEEWQRAKDASPVRVQWDPERDLHLAPLPWRAIQIGLSGPAVRDYVSTWIRGITDVTPEVHHIRGLLDAGDEAGARALLPVERAYRFPEAVARRVGARRQ